MNHNVGADELRVRARLRQLLDSPAAEPAVPPSTRQTSPRLPDWWRPKPDISPDATAEPEPAQRERDWLDDITDLDFAPQPELAPASDDSEPESPAQPQPAPAKTHRRPAFRKPARHTPRQSLADAWGNIPPRLRWLAYHATAAGAGWWLGWVDWATDTAAWYAAGHWTSPSAWVLYGLGACACGLYRRSRAWAWPFAWAAAVPVSSIVAGVLLYAPTQ